MRLPLTHLHELVDSSPAAFFKLLLFAPLVNHRRHLSLEATHVARIAAMRAEDCGACVQLAVYFARRDGVDLGLLRDAAVGDLSSRPGDLAEVHRFANTVAAGRDDPELRERLQQQLGQAAMVELGMVVATARFFPTFKRALGQSQSCRLVRVEA